nr:hypothetical protein [Deltaproteobacteria bacterium]
MAEAAAITCTRAGAAGGIEEKLSPVHHPAGAPLPVAQGSACGARNPCHGLAA